MVHGCRTCCCLGLVLIACVTAEFSFSFVYLRDSGDVFWSIFLGVMLVPIVMQIQAKYIFSTGETRR